MFCILVTLTVKDSADIAEVGQLLSRAAALSRQEPGCQRFEVYHSESDERMFYLNEWWESRAAWETHRTAEAYTTIYHPQVLPKVDRTPGFYKPISTGLQASRSGDPGLGDA